MLGQVLRWARTYYPADKFDHACRVAEFVWENDAICVGGDFRTRCYIVALAHDLLEDTDFNIADFKYLEQVYYNSDSMTRALKYLTHDKEKETYEQYIERIPKGSLAYWVKIADMKDHLTQTATLTDKLKEKYLRGLAILL